MKISIEKADFVLRLLTFLALVVGGLWAMYQYKLAGSDGWTNNVRLETKVLPYHDNLRLLVVHVRSKNPRNYAFELDSKQGDSFKLRFRKLAADMKEKTVIDEDSGDLIHEGDLLKEIGGEYWFAPGAEMDDMRAIVLPAGTIVMLTAEMQVHNGTLDAHAKSDVDFISASTVARIEL